MSMDIKELRKTLMLTQAEFAKKLDVNVATVSRWERGIKKPHPVYLRMMKRMTKNALLRSHNYYLIGMDGKSRAENIEDANSIVRHLRKPSE